jgi:hypothetical protein
MTIAQDAHALLDVTKTYAEDIARDVANRQSDPRSMCFWNIHNRVKVTEETLRFYESYWGSERFPEVDEGAEGELVERVMTVTKDLFVDVVSAVEKAAKDCVAIYASSGLIEKSKEKGSYLYLRNIMWASSVLGYIQEAEAAEWEDILTVRNLVTHNNSVSDRSKRCEVGGVVIAMRPGRMMKGPMNTFVALAGRTIELFHAWLDMMDDRFGKPGRSCGSA